IDSDPEDLFRDTRMSFGDHIEELRTHLLRALWGFAVGMIFGFWPLAPIVLRLIVDPLDDQLYQFEKRKLDKEMKDEQARRESRGLAPRSVRFQLELDKGQLQRLLGKNGAPEEAPPVLDHTVKGFERLLHDLDAVELLDEETRKAGNFIVLD